MNINEFWTIIEHGKDSDAPEVILEKHLVRLPPDEIGSFKSHLENLHRVAYRWDIWAAADMLFECCTDDGFMRFLFGLISRGQELYENALENPDSLAVLYGRPSISNETFGFVPNYAYEELTGNEMPQRYWDCDGSYMRGDVLELSDMGEEWDFGDEVECQKRLPKLSALLFSTNDHALAGA